MPIALFVSVACRSIHPPTLPIALPKFIPKSIPGFSPKSIPEPIPDTLPGRFTRSSAYGSLSFEYHKPSSSSPAKWTSHLKMVRFVAKIRFATTHRLTIDLIKTDHGPPGTTRDAVLLGQPATAVKSETLPR